MIYSVASHEHVCLLPLLQTYVVQATPMNGIFLHKKTRGLSTSNIPSFVEYNLFYLLYVIMSMDSSLARWIQALSTRSTCISLT
jgi:hypothetical protein